MSTVVIISALDEEAAHIAASLNDVTEERRASLTITHGTLPTHDGRELNVSVTVGGMGLVNAAATTQCLIDVAQPDAVLFSGIAGNLNPDLHINDIVLGETLRYLDTDMRLVGQWKPQAEEFHSDPELIALAEAALDGMGIHHVNGVIASGNYFVDSPEAVERVIRETHADAVEMEFTQSMTSRAEKGYILPGQMSLLSSAELVTEQMLGYRCVGVAGLANGCGYMK
ncbi:MAG: 5'-methylthioadenosine/S-adenosylhomocysteine nucleosidase, partial [Bifidobacterium criceti]|nr:5'-methylthioadenosine/S-adenosylhomocysteine nucleosidase [Bifidobacterium criceti]